MATRKAPTPPPVGTPISEYNRPDRKAKYGAKWKDSDGKRKFAFFEKESARNKFIKDVRRKTHKEGMAILELTSTQAAAMVKCLELLGDEFTVIQACQEYAKQVSLVDITAKEAIQKYQEEKRAIGRDANYQRAKRKHFERMEEVMPRKLQEWTEEQAREWALVLTRGYAPTTVKNHIRTGIAFCNWAIDRRYMNRNPFVKAPVPDVISKEVEFISVDTMSAFMECARIHFPDALAYAALNAFGGIRSSACARLGFESIHFAQKGILIRADIAKNKARLYLDGHPDNLWAWLDFALYHAPKGFQLTKRQWDKRREQIRQKAGIQMPHNALRHSFCTYHVAMHGDAGRTATLLSHKDDVNILYQHYKGNATKEQGKAYFSIMPPG